MEVATAVECPTRDEAIVFGTAGPQVCWVGSPQINPRLGACLFPAAGPGAVVDRRTTLGAPRAAAFVDQGKTKRKLGGRKASPGAVAVGSWVLARLRFGWIGNGRHDGRQHREPEPWTKERWPVGDGRLGRLPR